VASARHVDLVDDEGAVEIGLYVGAAVGVGGKLDAHGVGGAESGLAELSAGVPGAGALACSSCSSCSGR
jgi:hypothetical protein